MRFPHRVAVRMVAVDSSHLQWVAAAAAACRCPRPPAHHHRSTAESTRTVRVHAATMAVTMRVRHRHRTACEKRLSFLNFSYVCPEPVLVKRSVSVMNCAKVAFSYRLDGTSSSSSPRHGDRDGNPTRGEGVHGDSDWRRSSSPAALSACRASLATCAAC